MHLSLSSNPSGLFKYVLLVLLCSHYAWSSAQSVDTSRLDDLQISILTCGPGEEIYSLFGHSAVRVQQRSRDIDEVFNWGMFDGYGDPDFIIKFLRGKLDYSLGTQQMSRFLREYQYYQRYVDEQILDLDREEKALLLEAMLENNKAENRYYKYDFFYDNCSTRIRDLLEEHLAQFQFGNIDQPPITLRELIHTHLDNYNWTEFGMDLILGKGNDVIADKRDQMFLPLYLQDYAEVATTEGASIIQEETKLIAFPTIAKENYWISPDRLFWGLFIIEMAILFMAYIAGGPQFLRWWDSTWYITIGAAGLIMLFMWYGTDHKVCLDNYNILWAAPWAFLTLVRHRLTKQIILSLTIITSLISLIGWNSLPQYMPLAVIPISLITIFKSLRLLGVVSWIDKLKPAIGTTALIMMTMTCYSQERIAGITVVAPPTEFEADPMKEVSAVNANWIALVPFGFSRAGESKVQWGSQHQWWGERKEGIVGSVNLARNNNLKVMLKPQVWIPGSWVGDMDFDTEADWLIWESSYREYIMSFVDMAIEYDIEMICIGTEYRVAAVKRETFWRKLIQDIRSKYNGLLTYSSNWDAYQKVPFWDALDHIGISGYFPLSDMDTPPVMLLSYRWRKYKNKLRKYSEKIGKKILFTEYGYLSVDGAAGKTWELESQVQGLDINEQAQANGYDALFKAFAEEDFWAGGFLWKWFPEGMGHEGYPERDYTPQGKKAERILATWHQRITTTNDSNR